MPGLSSAAGAGAGAVRAGRAFVELFAEDNRVYRALDRLKGRLQALGGTLLKAGGGLAGLGTATAAAFKPAIDSIGDLGKIGDTADAFGISAEKASRLFGIMAAGGSDIRDATEGVVTFNQRIEDALTGTGEEAKKLFQDLGRGPETFSGGDTADRFYALLDALRQVPDPAKRVQLLLKAVGEDTGKNLIPLLSMSADEVRNLGDAFQTSAADVQSAREATRAQTMAVAQLKKILSDVAVAIAPVVKDIAKAVSEYARPVSDFVRNNREAFALVLKIALGAAAAGAGIAAFGAAFSAIGTGIGVAISLVKGFAVVIGALISPIGLVVAAFAGLGYLFVTQTEAGAEFFAWIKSGFASVADTVKQTWGGLTAALGGGDLMGAAKIAIKGLEVIWAELVHTLTYTWIGFKMTFLDGWRDLGDQLELILVRAMMGVVRIIADTVTKLFPILAGTARQAGLKDLATGLKENAQEAIKWSLAAAYVEKKREEELTKAQQDRLKFRQQEIRAADAERDQAGNELADMVAAAKAVEGLRGAAAALAIGANMPAQAAATQQAAKVAGSSGSFTAFAASQRFGGENLARKQLKATETVAANTAAGAKAVEDLAKGLQLK
ncbi:Uncharacterized protein OS=Isosphaera pallida (strain ATCC 43644 / DSM 9630 / IS1B) GN=Isop_2425 PE=4 SV=1 [Gemmata massiliana]|uniref:Phage tail tape measure protein n=1 Tax=Gemmata massiliana TaxID=1210884 RepID=A0A6P2DLK7_9BACT|nr:hypothetical protein [Gemmata massiliana]VTS01536.1 Uncharacterized protein OS=Isosphaera pallida (strain ATCC 43644 / DSM 9630 / IS1B) GN=Isop_2425 PE=4 SV=1 [Gemmata massiliana]